MAQYRPMLFHQRQFLPYTAGAPNLHTLSPSSSANRVLVSTDRSVALLDCAHGEYSLRELAIEELSREDVNVIVSGVIECPGGRDRAVVAFAVPVADKVKLYLQVIPLAAGQRDKQPRSPSPRGRESTSTGHPSARFELGAAPSLVMSVRALSTTGTEVFYGVILFRATMMVAFGFVDDKIDTATPSTQCVRLSSEQFANFFPEFDAFQHQVLAADTFVSSSRDRAWIAFGCADGFVRVFRGRFHNKFVVGPLEFKDYQMDGPVTSVTLFQNDKQGREQPSCCNLLMTCAVGRALVVNDEVLDADSVSEELEGADTFDSIFAGCAADIDLDGHVELLLGTDRQVVLAYKQDSQEVAVSAKQTEPPASPTETDDPTGIISTIVLELRRESTDDDDSAIGLPLESLDADSTAVEDEAPAPKWKLVPKQGWNFEAFGTIYSLLYRDVNRDGVRELLVASSTGVYVLEADITAVLRRLEFAIASSP